MLRQLFCDRIARKSKATRQPARWFLARSLAKTEPFHFGTRNCDLLRIKLLPYHAGVITGAVQLKVPQTHQEMGSAGIGEWHEWCVFTCVLSNQVSPIFSAEMRLPEIFGLAMRCRFESRFARSGRMVNMCVCASMVYLVGGVKCTHFYNVTLEHSKGCGMILFRFSLDFH